MKKRYIFTSLLVALLLSACGDNKNSSSSSSSTSSCLSSSLNSSSSTNLSSESTTTNQSTNSTSITSTDSSSSSSTTGGTSLDSSTSSTDTSSSSSDSTSSSIVQEKDLTKIDELLDFIDSFIDKEVEDISNITYEKEYIYYSGYTDEFSESGNVVAYDDNHIVNTFTREKTGEWSPTTTTNLQQYLGLYEEKPNYFYNIMIDSSEPKPFMYSYEIVDTVTNEDTQIAKADVNKNLSLNIFSDFKEFISDAVVASNGVIKKQGDTILLETTNYTTSNELDSSHDNKLECSFQFEIDNNDNIKTLTYRFREQEFKAYDPDDYVDIAFYSYSYEFSYGTKTDAAESPINPGMYIATSFDLQLETGSYYYEEVEPNALLAGNKVRGVAKNVVPATAIDVDLTIQSSSDETVVDLYGNIKKSGKSHLVFVSTGGITKEVDVVATAPDATSVSVFLTNSSTTYDLNDTVEFDIYYYPDKSEDTFAVSVTFPDKTVQTLQPNDKGKYSFVASQEGKYVINVQDENVESVSTTKEIDVVKPMADEEIIRLLTSNVEFTCSVMDYSTYDTIDYTLKFNADGTANITSSKSDWSGTPTETKTDSFTYKVENGKIVLDFPLTINGEGYKSGTVTFQVGFDSNNETIITSINFVLQATVYGSFSETFKRGV